MPPQVRILPRALHRIREGLDEKMRIRYDEKNDAIYIRFSEELCFESDEVKEGFILDYDKRGRVVGLEILDVSDR